MRAVIVGGSIAGLSAAQVLRRLGAQVVVLERSDGQMRERGAGLGLDLPVLQAVLGRAVAALPPCVRLRGRAVHAVHPVDGQTRGAGADGQARREPGMLVVSGWQLLHAALRAGLDDVVQTEAEVTALAHRAGAWQVTTGDGRHWPADLLIGADGHRSVVRRWLDPQAVPRYAGYLLWRGMVAVDALPAATRAQFLDGHLHLLPLPGHHLVAYEVPPVQAGGPRRLNWGWYVAASDGQREALVRRAGLTGEALIVPPGRLHAADRLAAVAKAAAHFPAPWAALIERTAATGGLFLNAIHEFVSTAAAEVPVALLGDAAHLLSPITGAGAGLAMRDALALGPALAAARAPGDLAQAMAERHRGAQRALQQARAWAVAALGADDRAATAAPVHHDPPAPKETP